MYSFKSRVRFSEVDSTLKLSLPSLVNYLQDCSTFHSEDIGNGMEKMIEEGHAWILSSWQIEIYRYPSLGEEITISTWAYGWRIFFGFRNYTIVDADDKMVSCANTNWIYMNTKTGHPDRITPEISDMYPCDPQLPMEKVSRKIIVPVPGIPLEPVIVQKSDIDANMHVNNERYLPIASKFLPDGFIVKKMRVEYKKSAVFGDTIYPTMAEDGERIYISLNDEAGDPYVLTEFQ